MSFKSDLKFSSANLDCGAVDLFNIFLAKILNPGKKFPLR